MHFRYFMTSDNENGLKLCRVKPLVLVLVLVLELIAVFILVLPSNIFCCNRRLATAF